MQFIGMFEKLKVICIASYTPVFATFRIKNKTNHLFVHLKLCIALALGLVVFIAGIETATNNEVGVLCVILS